MYVLASKLIGLPVLSLQSAETLTQVTGLVLNPDTLTVAAFECLPRDRDRHHPIIVPRDIRQIALDCILIDAEEVIGEADEVVRLAHLVAHPFELRNMRVITEMHRTLGRVADYSLNLDTFALQKIDVQQSIFHSWLGASLMIDRSQIIEITKAEIIVREASVTQSRFASWLNAKPVPKQ
jgi:uncharacterized protein YrrD